MQPTPAQTGAVSRLSYLWRSAHASEEPALARVLIREVLAVAAREGVELPSSALQRMCARCCSALAPGKNCTVSQRALKRLRGGGDTGGDHAASAPGAQRSTTSRYFAAAQPEGRGSDQVKVES